MRYRREALGRVYLGRCKWQAVCHRCSWLALSWQYDRGDDTGALPMMLSHLRTEHADLFERCGNCLADDPVCPVCNGRGWTWKED